jgi:surfactin synthase thioesterase subunit
LGRPFSGITGELQDKLMVNTVKSNEWFLFPRPNPEAVLRLFCFHYAGGSAQAFHPWLDHLPTTVEVGMVQLPGRGHRLAEPPITRVLPLSQTIARALQQYADKPLSFFGHSLGGLLCFEVTRSLRRDNHLEPAQIFVSATNSPHCPKRVESISALSKAALLKKLDKYNGTPPEVLQNDELLDLLLPSIRADFELCETYEYHHESPLSCPLTIYGGTDDNNVDREWLAAWREMSIGPSNMRMFPGGHFYFNTSQSLFFRTFSGDLLQLCSRLQKGTKP